MAQTLARGARLAAAAAALFALVLGGTAVAQEQPRVQGLPEPKPITVDVATTALLVLDMSARCANPQEVCSQLAPTLRGFVDRAREQGLLIVYTVSASQRGTPLGEVWSGFERRSDEPVLFPDAFDKFYPGDMHSLLMEHGIKTVIITGSSTNVAVLYTASGAARNHRYRVVVPLDGANASSQFEHDYSIYQLSHVPSVGDLFSFTTLDGIGFEGMGGGMGDMHDMPGM